MIHTVSWNISPAAAALHKDALVWDNHGIMPYEHTEVFLPQLRRYRDAGVTVAIINIGGGEEDLGQLVRMAARLRGFVLSSPTDFILIRTVTDILEAQRTGKLAVGFDIEGVYSLGEDLSLIELYYSLGVRWMLMVYNRQNLAGYGCHDDNDQGLTAYGHRVVAEMDRVGMIKCCSHTGYRTATDILEASAVPSIFSHSNPRELIAHPRNIPRELMTACARNHGVVCLNGVSIFLGDDNSRSETLVDHIDHVVQAIGPQHVGLGIDYVFDQEALDRMTVQHRNLWPEKFGYKPNVKFFRPEQLPEVTEILLRRGYSESDVRLILGGNLLRVATDVWK